MSQIVNYKGDLMDDFRLGRQVAFNEVFKDLYSSLCYYSFKITNNHESSQDIVSESFIKIWERREMFFEINVLKSYLYKTVRNASLDWIRKTAKIKALEDELIHERLLTENVAFKFNNIVEAETLNQVADAVSKLSKQGRQVMKMIYFEGKKIREVAQALGVSQSTVKTQKERALIKLRKTFNN